MSGDDLDALAQSAGLQTASARQPAKLKSNAKTMTPADGGDLLQEMTPEEFEAAQARAAEEEEKRLWETRIKITIPKAKGEPEDVFVGVNGKHYLIKRGTVADVPKPVYEALAHATQGTMDPETGEWHESPTYPFSLA